MNKKTMNIVSICLAVVMILAFVAGLVVMLI